MESTIHCLNSKLVASFLKNVFFNLFTLGEITIKTIGIVRGKYNLGGGKCGKLFGTQCYEKHFFERFFCTLI